ncbi:MAG: hypothetical protein ABFR33_05605 [Verrucomicrobiota bacterium]
MNKKFAVSVYCVVGIMAAHGGVELKTGTPLDRPYELDYRFKPVDWQSAICLVDDWQKTLVARSGAVLYDYPGKIEGSKHHGFGARVDVPLANGRSEWVSQELLDPRFPAIRTIHKYGKIEFETVAFAATGALEAMPSTEASERQNRNIEVIGKPATPRAWARPNRTADIAFGDIHTTEPGGTLEYRFRAEAGRMYFATFGFCEGRRQERGGRIVEILLEGRRREVVDLVGSGRRNTPMAVCVNAADENGDGWVDVEILAAEHSEDKAPILNAMWVFENAPDLEEVVRGNATRDAYGYFACGDPAAMYTGAPRVDLVLAKATNPTDARATANPQVRLSTSFPIDYDAAQQLISMRGRPMVNISVPVKDVIIGQESINLICEPATLEPGESKEWVVAIHREAQPLEWSVEKAKQALADAEAYWMEADLPYGTILVPDENVQALLESSIRNIYQARVMRDGLPAFQVGPTCFRGLWVIDGAFLLESISMLGRMDQTRSGVEYMMRHQNENGSFSLIEQHWKETGIILWVIDRHHQLTGDEAWLREQWPKVKAAVGYIESMRNGTLATPDSPSSGLMPAGYSDGGLNRDDEYTNTYWVLVGLKSAAEMALRLGMTEQHAAWSDLYAAMMASYRKAAQRDLHEDGFGNKMLPIPMTRPLANKPQKAQWAFCHAVHPGEIFAKDDAVMLGTMNNLVDNEREGLVYGTGWETEGVWNYFGSFYAHAFLWLGEGEKAAQTTYAFGNHASPLGAWREEQNVVGEPIRLRNEMPHNWASAEFIRSVYNLVVFERDDELHLFEGLPTAWLKPGATLEINGAVTRFGKISLTLQVSDDGKTATLDATPPTRTPATKIVVHGAHWLAEGKNLELSTDKPNHLVLKLK